MKLFAFLEITGPKKNTCQNGKSAADYGAKSSKRCERK